MKKIKLKETMNIQGYGVIAKGTAFKVVKYNSRFIYVEVISGVTLRLARKKDCEVVY